MYETRIVEEGQRRSKVVHGKRSGRPVEIVTKETVRNAEGIYGVDRRTTIIHPSRSISVSCRLKPCTILQLLLLFVTTSFFLKNF